MDRTEVKGAGIEALATAEDDAVTRQVFARAVATLYEHAPRILAANVINAGLMTLVLWGRVPATWLLTWLGAIVVMAGARWIGGRGFDPDAPPSAMRRWARRFTLGSATAGALWGAGVLGLFGGDDLAVHVLWAFIIGGMAAGASSSSASHLPAFYAYVGPTVLPLLVRFVVEGDRVHLGMAGMIGLGGVLVLMIGRTTHRRQVEATRLALVNDRLLGRLGEAHRELEATNADLEARVQSRTLELQTQIEARREAERRLLRTQKLEAVGRLTGGVAHDFNNLLTVIVGALEGILHTEDPERRELLVDQARQAALRGGGLTRSLLAFSRSEKLEPELLDAAAVVDRLTDVMVRRVLPESVELVVSVPPEATWLEVDPAHFEAALLNLILNARDAIGDHGRLTVQVRATRLERAFDHLEPGDYVEIRVSDDGSGIAPELLDRIFEPFFTTKGERGSGLGLSMVYGFARQSGGVIRLDSAPRHGTAARLLLPRVRGPAHGHTVDPGESARAPLLDRGDGETVLLVEDEDDIRELAAASLVALGYRPLTARDAAEALDLFERSPGIDLLMTDVVMPGGMDGVALAKALRSRAPHLPVVVVSGFAESSEALEAFEQLPKPYRRAALAKALRRALKSGTRGSAAAPRSPG